VQSAELGDTLGAGTQHQVIGVSEHDFGAGLAHLIGQHRLDRAGGADRHESRRFGGAMRGLDLPAPCRPVAGQKLEFHAHEGARSSRQASP
jgi:hypothetical protein